MPRLTFVVPVHAERVRLAAVCLRQLHRTCEALTANGVHANAVVVSDAESLDELDPLALGFATVERDNDFLGRRFNDGIQLATDPAFNPAPADYVVPFGSDDWADHRLFLEPLPADNEIQGFQTVAFVNEDATEIAETCLRWQGGSGIRIIPRALVAPLGYRPCDEDRPHGCDTSILSNLRRHHGDRLRVVDSLHLHGCQIVDWKTAGHQLHTFRDMTSCRSPRISGDPFAVLAEFYPVDAIEEMRHHYAQEVAYA